MFDSPNVKVNELADIYACTNASVSMYFKRNPDGVVKNNNRISGVEPEAVEQFFISRGFERFSESFIVALGTNVGGAGKTSSTVNLATSARRMTGRDKAVVLIDTDSQASLTSQMTGRRTPKDEFVLDDYLQEKCDLTDILTPLGAEEDNFWLIGSNLSNLYLDRRFNSGTAVKNGMLKVFKEINNKFGHGTKIFVDTPPQLSAISQSIMCALAQIDILSVFLVPIRPDSFSLDGARICISEMKELKDSYKGVDEINTRCFLSSYDSRLQVSMSIMRDVLKDDLLSKYLCSTIVRHSTEVTRSAYKQESVFSSSGKSAKNLISDYTKLLLEVLGFNSDWKAHS